MSSLVLTDCNIFLNAVNLTAQVTEATVSVSRPEVDSTTFASGGNRERRAGIGESMIEAMSFYDDTDAAQPHSIALGTPNSVMTVTADATTGATAYFGRGPILRADRGFPVGAMGTLNTGLAVSAPEGIVPGRQLQPLTFANTDASGTGTQLGAVSATQRIYAALHVVAFGTSTSIAVKIQSDDNSGFTSPTDRITFTTNTAVGFEMLSLAGSITDTWWRATWDVTSPTPSIAFAVVAGIK